MTSQSVIFGMTVKTSLSIGVEQCHATGIVRFCRIGVVCAGLAAERADERTVSVGRPTDKAGQSFDRAPYSYSRRCRNYSIYVHLHYRFKKDRT